MPGLDPLGVPKSLAGSVHPFQYNDLDALKKIIANHSLAAVKMEVQRSDPPANGFLSAVRDLCTTHNIVLIFDECTSGFRETFGGLHLKYNVSPDLAVFGKALGNGYAISSVIGKESIMQAAQSTFISSTFWTERIGPSAGLAALAEMSACQSWNIITELGIKLRTCWQTLSDTHSVPITISGIPALSSFTFNSPDHFKYKTYITQEMLKKGFLATTTCYLCTAHSTSIFSEYISLMEPIFSRISDCENGTLNIDNLLEGPVCHSGFKRLN